MTVIETLARAFFRIGQRAGQLPVAQMRKGGGSGSAPANTHDVVGDGATVVDVVAINNANDVVQVGA